MRCDMKSSRVHHEVEALERFVSFIDAVQQVQHFKREVDDKGVEQIARDGIDAGHVDLHAAQLRR